MSLYTGGYQPQTQEEWRATQRQIAEWREQQGKLGMLIPCLQPGTTAPITKDACARFRSVLIGHNRHSAARAKLLCCVWCPSIDAKKHARIRAWLGRINDDAELDRVITEWETGGMGSDADPDTDTGTITPSPLVAVRQDRSVLGITGSIGDLEEIHPEVNDVTFE
jgi:hypothetical protein